jgi:glycosyltransferase involved in cell wall biosynthesis
MAPVLPTITAVVVTRDRPRLLEDALRDIAAQRLPPLEVRIADDGDHPVSRESLAAFPIPIEAVRVYAGRAATARNRGAAGARGEVLAFLDDDDRWLRGHLAGLAEAFRDPDVRFAWRDCAVIQEIVADDGSRHEQARRVIAHDWDPGLMRHDDYLPPSGWAVRRTLFERLGGFDEGYRFSEDWDFVLRAAALTTPVRVPGVTVEVRMRPQGNLSSARGGERLDCLRRLAAQHRLPPLEPKTFWEVALAVDLAAGHLAPP